MGYKEYNESSFNEVRRKTKKREIEEAFDDELESFVDIDFYCDGSVSEFLGEM